MLHWHCSISRPGVASLPDHSAELGVVLALYFDAASSCILHRLSGQKSEDKIMTTL